MGTMGRETLTVTAELPAPNDGGADDSAVPQTLLGYAASENLSSPPVRMIDSGSHVRSVGQPAMLSPLMCFRGCGPDAPGGEIRMNLLSGSAITTRSNS